MNRGVLQSSPVKQMMAGNPNNWWNINTMRPPPPPPQASPPFFSTPSNFLTPYYTPTSSLPLPSWHDNNQELPESWSQLLMSGMVSEEEKGGMCQVQSKKLENWEQQMLSQAPSAPIVDVKQESSVNSYAYGHGNEEFQPAKPTWSQIVPASSPKSCVTSFSSSMLDFSNNNTDARPPPPDPSSECDSAATGGAFKKARVQPPTTQSTFKTDTASVLLEAIGYIRFLQSQIEALSLPYLGSGSGNMRQQQSVQGENNCIFPEDPGQLLNENCLKRKAASEQDSQEEPKKDLRSRGLCLVPVSCTLQVGSDNGADYWAPAFGGGFR
uniref:BHLH domain-containing protein n=1 Tax=Glycine max TaxID=3847 RepID=K7KRP2_SOYBN